MVEEPEAHQAGDSSIDLLGGVGLDRLPIFEAVGVNHGVGEAVGGDRVRVEGELVSGESQLEGVHGSVEAPVALRYSFEVRLTDAWRGEEEVRKLQRLVRVVTYLERGKGLAKDEVNYLGVVDAVAIAEGEVSGFYPAPIQLPIDVAVELATGEEVVGYGVEWADGLPALGNTARGVDEEGYGAEVIPHRKVHGAHRTSATQ